MKGTSVASLARENGERHVFFQEQGGNIRKSIYKTNSWTTPINYIVVTDGRNNTPLTAIHIPPLSAVDPETVRSFSLHLQDADATLVPIASSLLHMGQQHHSGPNFPNWEVELVLFRCSWKRRPTDCCQPYIKVPICFHKPSVY